LEGKHIADKLSTKAQTINNTEQSKIITEESHIKENGLRKAQNGSANSAKVSKTSKQPQSTTTNIDSR
jgi:hypothetical protein